MIAARPVFRACALMSVGLAACGATAPAQSNQWVWMGGSSIGAYGQNGTYGTKGVPAPGNVPGDRTSVMSWTDAAGNLWLFGGNGGAGVGFNDLWKYDPSINEWTWISGNDSLEFGVYGTKGVPAAANVPGGREAGVTWTDRNGNLWLFGGWGYDASGIFGSLNDLWKFDPASGLWTWISGSSTLPNDNLGCPPGVYGTMGTPSSNNVPGGRLLGTGWTASDGALWLFGGGGCDANDDQQILNDLWRFDPATTEWTWMGGSSIGVQAGVYGTLGTPDAGNVPGGRWNPVAWTDKQGNFWMFGGSGYDSTDVRGYLNDLWEYIPASGQWAWMSGNSTLGTDNCYQPDEECARSGVYGTRGQPAPGNVPPGREGAVGSVDEAGNFLLFGGNNNPRGVVNLYNDLWEFNPATREWAWLSGSNTMDCAAKDNSGTCIMAGEYGKYGSLGVPAASNVPGSRSAPVSWSDNKGNFWLFGGDGFDSIVPLSYLNDLWSYQRPAPDFSLASNANALSIKAGGQGSVTLTITPQNGFDSAVTFSCSGLPSGTTCSFSPATVTPSGGQVQTKLTIAASTSASVARPDRSPLLPAAALALAGCLLFADRRRNHVGLAVLLLFFGLAGVTACSNVNGMNSQPPSPPPPPPPTVATVTITAVSGSIRQTATLTLTVTH